jgi:membrane-bound serine protease (ClpP class)
MTSIIDPNLAYVLVVGGFVLSVLAILTPGTGVVEIGGIFALVLGGYGVISNPTNLWALIFIFPFFPLIFTYRKSKKDYYLGLAIILLNIVCYTIFRGENRLFAVSIFLGFFVVLINAPIIWFIVKRVTEAIDKTPDFNPMNIVGKMGEARSNLALEGTVYVDGEEWSAKSKQKIIAGQKIRVIAKEGLTLLVEEDNNNIKSEV